MKAINTNNPEITITRDGQVTNEFQPSPLEASVSHVQAIISRFTGNVALQARMAVYDARSGTNYREIRNNLARQKRDQEFERSIGLVAVK